MLTWDDSMATGIPAIDGQHRELIERYNAFDAALSSSSLSARDEAGEILDFLQFYAIWHFEREEHCFEEYQCPIAAANKQAHAEFIESFGQFYEQWQTEGMDQRLIRATFADLGAWIQNHILGLDTQARFCLNNHEGTPDLHA